jgi:hypothetical protein
MRALGSPKLVLFSKVGAFPSSSEAGCHSVPCSWHSEPSRPGYWPGQPGHSAERRPGAYSSEAFAACATLARHADYARHRDFTTFGSGSRWAASRARTRRSPLFGWSDPIRRARRANRTQLRGCRAWTGPYCSCPRERSLNSPGRTFGRAGRSTARTACLNA